MCCKKKYQKKLNLDFDIDFIVNNEPVVWKYVSNCNVKSVYALLVKTNDNLKCITKWSDVLDTDVNAKEVFRKIVKTTGDTSLRWFQYQIIYRLLPCARFLFQRKIVDSPLCTFCENAEETLSHLLWECPKVQEYWSEVQSWFRSNFTHCNTVLFSEQLIVLGCTSDFSSDRVFDMLLLEAKRHIYISKLKGKTPHINIFIHNIKTRFQVEKYHSIVNHTYDRFCHDWIAYEPFFL